MGEILWFINREERGTKLFWLIFSEYLRYLSVCLCLIAGLIDWLIDEQQWTTEAAVIAMWRTPNVEMCIRRLRNNNLMSLELHSSKSYNYDFELKGIWKEQSWHLWMFCSLIGPGPNPGIELGIFRIKVSCTSIELVIWIFESFLDDLLLPRSSFGQSRRMLSRYKWSEGQNSGSCRLF
jgi:hypothetical protein